MDLKDHSKIDRPIEEAKRGWRQKAKLEVGKIYSLNPLACWKV